MCKFTPVSYLKYLYPMVYFRHKLKHKEKLYCRHLGMSRSIMIYT